MHNNTLPQLEVLVLTSLVFPTLFPTQAYAWLVFLTIAMYLATSYKLYVTTKATGNHRFGKHNTYICRKSRKRTQMNEDGWNASGNEHCFGIIGFGKMKFINSFHVPGWCKYVSLRVEIPCFFSSGIDIGVVQGYSAYHDEGQMSSGMPIGNSLLFFMAPTIRWSAAHEPNNFISIRQFGTATVTTEGSIHL